MLDLDHNLIRLFGFFKPLEQAREQGEITSDLHYIRMEGGNVKAGTVFINTTRVYHKDGIDPRDLVQSEVEARQQIEELIRFMRKRAPGFKECVLIVDSLLVAGRCLSATHNGDQWTRPMPVCITTGQAAGVAAALAVLSQTEPRNLDIPKLQLALKKQNVNLEFR